MTLLPSTVSILTLSAALLIALNGCVSTQRPAPYAAGSKPTTGQLIKIVLTETGQSLPNAARAPFRDFNMMKEDVPRALLNIEYPYRIDGPVYCDQLIAEINALNAVLGNSQDIQAAQLSPSELTAQAASNAAQNALESAATDWIPYRSALRRLTGAHAHEREIRRAYDRGRLRRAFLKGVGGAFQCPYPARPASTLHPMPLQPRR